MADSAAALTMPDAFQHYCEDPACREKTAGRFCPAHERATSQRYDRERGSSAARGYDRKWQRYVTGFRARYPICGDRPPEAPKTADSVCQASGILRPMFVVDHIRPVSGPDDPSFYDPANHQALCEPCHNSKRRRERGGVFPGGTGVTIVCGPPGSGKSTFVATHAQPGDLIVDLDALFQALSGLPLYEKPDALLPFVAEARDAVIARLSRPSDVKRAWIITGAPTQRERNDLSTRFGGATIWILDVPREECIRRCQADPRRTGQLLAWSNRIHKWWSAYQSGL